MRGGGYRFCNPSRKIFAFSAVADILEIWLVSQGAQITCKFTYKMGMGIDLEAKLICWKAILTVNLRGVLWVSLHVPSIGKPFSM